MRQLLRFQLLVGLLLLANTVLAQINSASPNTFLLDPSRPAPLAGIVTAPPSPVAPSISGTGNRVATAQVCASLLGASGPGIYSNYPCSSAMEIGTLFPGATTSVAGSQTFAISVSSVQATSYLTHPLVAAQPSGSRRVFVILQYQNGVGSALPVTNRYAALQVNLVEPVGLLSVGAGLRDVASDKPTVISIRYVLAGPDNALGGQFCSALSLSLPSSGVTSAQPCVASSVLAASGSASGFVGNVTNTGEALIVSEFVARKALRAAQQSGQSVFYFVRQFSSGKFATTALRINNGGTGGTLSFSDMRLVFVDGTAGQSVLFVKRGQAMPPMQAWLRYQGAGLLRARWEVITPGDTWPTDSDLSTALTHQQRRWSPIGATSTYLPPTGYQVVQGPASQLLPTHMYGQYMVVLRIEESPTNGLLTTTKTMPILRYFVGESSTADASVSSGQARHEIISLLSPAAEQVTDATTADPLTFRWLENTQVGLYRLELQRDSDLVFSARVKPRPGDGQNYYSLPPLVKERLSACPCEEPIKLRWRVVSLSSTGRFAGESEWRSLVLNR